MILDADTHNFGKKTTLEDGCIVKFRSLVPEYLFLGSDSLLRKRLNEISRDLLGTDILPSLKVYSGHEEGVHLGPSRIEFLKVGPLTCHLTDHEILQTGAMIALFAFVGLTDSHSTNLIYGHKKGKFEFTSLDWETVLTDIKSPHELTLFKMLSECNCPGPYCNNFGLSFLLKNSSDPKKLSSLVMTGFAQMTEKLIASEKEIQNIIDDEIRKRSFSRRCVLKPTIRYVNKMAARDYSDLIPEEIIQMKRGDIPYFFAIAGREGIFYWGENNSIVEAESYEDLLAFNQMKKVGIDKEFFQLTLKAIAQSLDADNKSDYENAYGDFQVIYRKDVANVLWDGKVLSIKRLL